MEYYRNGEPRQRDRFGIAVLIAVITLLLAAGLLIGLLFSISKRQEADLTAVPTAVPSPTAAAAATDSRPEAAVSQSSTEFLYDGRYTRAQIVELCAPSVVGIDATFLQSYWGQAYETAGSGSGVIITADGYIVTCAHVVQGASSVTVTLSDDTAYDAAIVGTDTRNDLAVLKIEAQGLSPATFGDSEMLTVGEDVIAIGNPLGELRGTATSGIISAVRRSIVVEDVEMELVQTDAAISPGNSGGGLFNASGQLIGIVNAKMSDTSAEGLGFAIPIHNVLQEINDFLNYGYVTGRAYLGVYTQNVSLRSDYGMFAATYCVQVADVVEGGAAHAAGIRVGDLILAVDDLVISSNTDLSDAIAVYNAGDTAILTIQRNGQRSTVTVTFSEYVPDN